MATQSQLKRLQELEVKTGRRDKHNSVSEVSADLIARVRDKLHDPLNWLQYHTQTKDPHWREVGTPSPYRPFPDKPYFRPILDALRREPIVFCAKSRDLMLSWLFVGFF